MHRQLAQSALLIVVLALAASATDLTGNWKGEMDHPQGKVTISYSFKQDGETLTGTWQAAQSPTVQISEGQVKGDKVSFAVKINASGGMIFAHEGKFKGDEIEFTMKPSGEFPGSTVIAKRVK